MIVDTIADEQDLLVLETVINGDEHAGQAIRTTATVWHEVTVIIAIAGRDMTQGITL